MTTDLKSANIPIEHTELVRGQDQRLLEQLLPFVRRESVCLDLRPVERIDAAGLAALIKLYCAARDAGHDFAVANASPHVAEILALVGLDKLFASRCAERALYLGVSLQESAA
jgi:anti-anti-sigma factor